FRWRRRPSPKPGTALTEGGGAPLGPKKGTTAIAPQMSIAVAGGEEDLLCILYPFSSLLSAAKSYISLNVRKIEPQPRYRLAGRAYRIDGRWSGPRVSSEPARSRRAGLVL